MKFVIKSISKNSGRLGQLRIKESRELQTPLLMQTTKGGSIPYLTADAFELVSNEEKHLLQLTLSTMDQMADSLVQWNRCLSEYVGFPGHSTVLLLRDPCDLTPAGGNDRDVVPLFTRRGKESLTATQYLEMVAKFAPDVYQGLCDADTSAESTKKRVQKSVDRTERFMNECYEQHGKLERLANSTLLAPIVGGYNTYARTQSIKHARQQPTGSYGGYVFEGFHTNGLAATALKAAQLLPVVEHCLQQLEDEMPRLMPDKVEHSAFLDLTDEATKEEFTPILSGCSCLACRKHTRAYVHHLYKTHELLGPILLMIHNLHHYMSFFDAIRASIEADQLPELIEHVRLQNTDSEIDYRIEQNVKVVGKAAMGKGFVAAAV
ncbi:queuine tRNA-ribosyltransferase accessory subunit 2 isoform X2 [Drosophila innubila]|uniref:queuine tRNA-ribosyltransferase accessory subunit 2 isoform X2 n=1 Tax=Drosophila innubila TaxID=198719 RepID=UPI00148D367D|nr:queuine tRNA-ribosyltransferase accessory subunit 2 isoform X2 [Drosophila innubila]